MAEPMAEPVPQSVPAAQAQAKAQRAAAPGRPAPREVLRPASTPPVARPGRPAQPNVRFSTVRSTPATWWCVDVAAVAEAAACAEAAWRAAPRDCGCRPPRTAVARTAPAPQTSGPRGSCALPAPRRRRPAVAPRPLPPTWPLPWLRPAPCGRTDDEECRGCAGNHEPTSARRRAGGAEHRQPRRRARSRRQREGLRSPPYSTPSDGRAVPRR